MTQPTEPTQPTPEERARYAAIAMLLVEVFVKLSTLGFVPKGWLTKGASAMQILTGLGMLSSQVVGVVQTGTIPDQVSFADAFGMLMLGTGGATAGIGRKVEMLAAQVEKVASALTASGAGSPPKP